MTRLLSFLVLQRYCHNSVASLLKWCCGDAARRAHSTRDAGSVPDQSVGTANESARPRAATAMPGGHCGAPAAACQPTQCGRRPRVVVESSRGPPPSAVATAHLSSARRLRVAPASLSHTGSESRTPAQNCSSVAQPHRLRDAPVSLRHTG
eukprot:gene3117-biopygen4918